MTTKKWPEDGYPDNHVEMEGIIFEDTENLPAQTRVQLTFLQEAERIGRFDKYRKIAIEYLDLAREAKTYADQTLPILIKILTVLPFPRLVLQVENIINRSRPIVQRTVVMLGSNMQLDHDEQPRYNEHNLSSAALSSELAHSDLLKILKDVDFGQGPADEGQMELPAITDRQKRIAGDKNIPPNIRKREIPRLTDELQKNLNIFAAGNAFITLHDIDGLMATLHTSKQFFRSELDEWRSICRDVETMRESGFSDEEIKNILERFNIRERIQVFHDMYLRLDASLKITLARMEFVNQKDNEILAQEYDRGLIKKLLKEVISGALKQGNGGGFVRNLIGKLLGRAEKPKPGKKEQGAFEKTLRQALKDRTT